MNLTHFRLIILSSINPWPLCPPPHVNAPRLQYEWLCSTESLCLTLNHFSRNSDTVGKITRAQKEKNSSLKNKSEKVALIQVVFWISDDKCSDLCWCWEWAAVQLITDTSLPSRAQMNKNEKKFRRNNTFHWSICDGSVICLKHLHSVCIKVCSSSRVLKTCVNRATERTSKAPLLSHWGRLVWLEMLWIIK